MKKLVIVLILIIVLSLKAETYQGYVYDQERKPLQEVLVIHGQNSTFSQENGYFFLNSKSQADSLIIYYAFHEIVKIAKEDFDSVMSFTLKPLDLELSAFTFTSKRKNSQLPSSQEKVTISLKDKQDGNSNLAEVITQDKSITIEGTQLPGEKQTASILGHSARHTLVMLDGIPLNNNGEDFDLASIPVELVDEVEIYKNNVSSLSGGGGMAGLINIKTKKTSNNANSEFSIKGNYGSYNFKKLSLSSGFSLANTSFYTVFSQQEAKNDFKFRIKKGNDWFTLKRDNNSKKTSNAMLNLSSKFSFFDLYYNGNISLYDNQLPGPTNALELYNGARIEGYDFLNSLKLSKKLARVNNSLEFYNIHKKSNYTNLNANISLTKADNESENKRYGLKLQNFIDFDKLQFTIVNSYLKESYSHTNKFQVNNSIAERSQYSYANNIISQYSDNISLFNYNVIASVRHDKHSVFKDFSSYRLSGDVSYDHIIKPTLLFSYGNSFTIPSFYSLYWKGDSHAEGNPNLTAEESQGYQLGFQVEYSTLKLKFNHSYNEIDNLIQWVQVQVQSVIWKPLNIGSSEIANNEIQFSWEPLEDLMISSEAVFSKTKNKTLIENGLPSASYGKELVYIPDFTFNINLDYTYQGYNVKAEYSKTGKQWITQDNLKAPLDGYELVNLSLAKKLRHGKFEHDFSLNLNNILNNYYEIYKYNPQAPFNWACGYGIKYLIK